MDPQSCKNLEQSSLIRFHENYFVAVGSVLVYIANHLRWWGAAWEMLIHAFLQAV